MSRYDRQTILPEVGAEGQARLAAATVLIVGAGGLGVPVIQYLAGAGVGRLRIVDPDRAEAGNLHRQPIYGAHLGQPKATAAAALVQVLNPEVAVEAMVARLDPANAPGLLAGAALAVDCADSFAASYTLSDACAALRLPLISGSVLGMEGYAGGFCGPAPTLRALFPDLPERTATCATAGVFGPVVGTIGTIMAQMALSAILGLAPSPLGQLVTWDARGFRLGGFRFDTAPEPGPGPRFIALSDLRATDLLVELRGAAEAPDPFAAGALRLSVEDMAHAPVPAPGRRAVLACRSGLRAWRAAERLAARWDGEIALIATGDPQ